ncbi:MAG: hypothetical protein JRG76_02285 [Deltaproteobacteria bacterium]|nr:hypothetical protein [Deltaproteobacteria bacterium]MBW2413315.1 hypothetical protein [Deltaproteobacteria bacterium]
MRVAMIVAAVSTCLLTGCMPALQLVGLATYPLNKKGKFEDVQSSYTSNLRYGLYDEAKAFVEPELRARFAEAARRYSELRLSDHRLESIEIDALRTEAIAVVVFRGYWLSSPYEREMRSVQRWRRQVPTQNWFVTPDFDALIAPPSESTLLIHEPRSDVSAPQVR